VSSFSSSFLFSFFVVVRGEERVGEVEGRTRNAEGMTEPGVSGAEGRVKIGAGSNTQVHHHFKVKGGSCGPRQL
jgi:hypothetical protein